MSSNYNFILDYQGDDSDWIELYNNTSDTIFLKDYYLSDNEFNLQKWRFPDIYMCPNSFSLVFASGKDTVFENGEIHTGFAVSQTGEKLILSKNNNLVSVVESQSLNMNKSFGQYPDASMNWAEFDFPSPNASNRDSLSEKLVFSHLGGFYDSIFVLQLSGLSNTAEVYYTIDGSLPSRESFKYENGILISDNVFSPINITEIQISPEKYYYVPETDFPKAIIIKAAGFNQEGAMCTPVYSNTFFIADLGIKKYNLPVVSITASYDDLFDFYKGILVPGVNFIADSSEWTGNYYQRGEEWERAANVEIYNAQGNCIFNNGLGLRTHGGNSRRMPQKGFKLYACGKYGTKEMTTNIFTNFHINEFHSLVLKPFCASWSGYGAEDYLASQLVKQLECDYIQTIPTIVYLNGEYWGIYYIQEEADEDYIKQHYDLEKEECVIAETWNNTTNTGISDSFSDLFNYVNDNGLQSNAYYYEFCKRVNINKLIDYYLFELFISNFDWSANNMKCWLDKNTGLWSWIFYDGDAGFGDPDFNSFNHANNISDDYWPNNKNSTLFFRELSKNSRFSNAFAIRLIDVLNNEFNSQNLDIIFDDIFSEISPNIVMQVNRFNFPESIELWKEIFQDRKIFLQERPCYFIKQTEKYFNLNLPNFNCQVEKQVICFAELYPMPAHTTLTIKLMSEFVGPAIVNISDITGRRVFEKIVLIDSFDYAFDVEIGDLQNGIYMLNIYYNNNITGKQIMVLR
jgi:hypothetical protein